MTDAEDKKYIIAVEKAGRELNVLLDGIQQDKRNKKDITSKRKQARYLCAKLASLYIQPWCFCNFCSSLTRVTFQPTPGVLA